MKKNANEHTERKERKYRENVKMEKNESKIKEKA